MSVKADALRAWLCAKPAEGTPAEKYLRHFAIIGPLPGSFRAESTPAGAALLARVTDSDGHLTAVHRMPLTNDGAKNGEEITVGPLGTGAVRVTPSPAHFSFLGIAATVEVALAVATGRPGFPVWASLRDDRLGRLWIPRAINMVVLFTDAAEASARAAEEAEEIYRALGKLTHVEHLGDHLTRRVA